MEDDKKFSNTTRTFWFGDTTSRTMITFDFPLAAVLSVTVETVNLTVVASFSDHRCQGNSKVMECGGSSFFKVAFLTEAMKSIKMPWVCEEVCAPL